MKRTQIAVIAAAFALSLSVQAQTWTWSNMVRFASAASDAKSVTLALSPSYAPDLTVAGKKAPWGVGAAAVYPVLTLGPVQTLTGIRLDWLANQFFAPSVSATVQAPLILFNKVEVTPFGIGGAIFPLGQAGATDAVGAIYGGGLGIKVFSWERGGVKGAVSVGGGVERWTPYPGNIYRVGGAVTLKF